MELNRGDGSMGTILGVHAGLGMKTIAMLGSEEQKQQWLAPMARCQKLGAFALTEPEHGSDSIGLETSARRDGDSYVINGRKKWIGNGTAADVIVVWARDTADGQVKGYLVEKGTPGYTARKIEGKGSLRAVWQAEIELEDLRVPAENKLPGANSFKDTAAVLVTTRASCAWMALGHAVAGYDAALTYAKRRTQFGTARQVLAEARDLLGGNGILLDFHVIRHMADIEAIHTFEGTETIQNLIVGRDITGVSAFT
jgi:glutaryl-CoA dehydrogenase